MKKGYYAILHYDDLNSEWCGTTWGQLDLSDELLIEALDTTPDKARESKGAVFLGSKDDIELVIQESLFFDMFKAYAIVLVEEVKESSKDLTGDP